MAGWGYCAALLAAALVLHLGGDYWWPATVLLFGPRWILALPLAPAAAAAFLRPRSAPCLIAGTLLVLFPLMGFCVPLRATPSPATLRVVTCNVQGEHVRREALLELVASSNADLILLQEFSREDDLAVLSDAGWHVRKAGTLGIASLFPIESVEHHASERGAEAAYCRLRLPARTLGVCNVHLESPRSGLDAILDRRTLFRPAGVPLLRDSIEQRRRDSADLARWVRTLGDLAIVGGDFNMPPESTTFRRDWGGFRNCFSDAGWGFGYTRRASVHGVPYGARIDHLLLVRDYRACRARVGPDIGSDHLPLIAEIADDAR